MTLLPRLWLCSDFIIQSMVTVREWERTRNRPPRDGFLSILFLRRFFISIEIELLPPGLKLSGRVRISTAERESRSPLFSLSGNGPVCHPHAGSVCLGGCS